MLPCIVLDGGFMPSSSQFCSKQSSTKPKKITVLISRFCWLYYGSLDLRWNSFRSCWHRGKLPLQTKDLSFFVGLLSRVQSFSFLPRDSAEWNTGGQLGRQHISCQITSIVVAKQILCWAEVQTNLIIFLCSCTVPQLLHACRMLLWFTKHKSLDTGGEVTEHVLCGQGLHLYLRVRVQRPACSGVFGGSLMFSPDLIATNAAVLCGQQLFNALLNSINPWHFPRRACCRIPGSFLTVLN